MQKVLVTGIKSGLGRFLHERFNSLGWSRETSETEKAKIRQEGVNIIIHCAFNSSRDITSETLPSYLNDNVVFTKELLQIPHKQFIFMSSVDVYPSSANEHQEEEKIDVQHASSMYVVTKLMSESMVLEKGKKPVILRASALLGPYCRFNSLIRMLEQDPCALTLARESVMNYVRYSDVADFITLTIDKDLQGIYNVTSLSNMGLSEVAQLIGKPVTFGSYLYQVGAINNQKIRALCPVFKQSSKEVVQDFIQQWQEKNDKHRRTSSARSNPS